MNPLVILKTFTNIPLVETKVGEGVGCSKNMAEE